jgi:hypothetical protein
MPPTLKSLAPARQDRLDQLLDKNAEGGISLEEKAELDALVAEAEQLMLSNARALADFASSQSPQPPAAAVPVTVWVTPHPAES